VRTLNPDFDPLPVPVLSATLKNLTKNNSVQKLYNAVAQLPVQAYKTCLVLTELNQRAV
jgi:hypothetical protein